ncbi:type II secretion system F family protein [Sanguibacter suaedae]|uniref:Type II secretion system F family protein n=1 Tax=Sanguibacter suaedae TaxID=2795737 RepID=A0A934MAU2_9MICO|nr:type II secretion system F family protein [Sanguibacter suaedae]MBI9115975.1 type II secretion system F family protein [Sanguibacter suaedae]
MTPVVAGVVVAVLVGVGCAPWSAGRSRASRVGVGRGARSRRVRGGQGGAAGESAVELTVVVDLLAAAIGAGAALPRSVACAGDALGGPDGAALRGVGSALLLGTDWDTAWSAAPARFRPVADALRTAWTHGAAPRDALRLAAAQVAQDARARSRTAAARLAVRLVLPLGACFLPAFVLVGLVPVLLALGSGVLGG